MIISIDTAILYLKVRNKLFMLQRSFQNLPISRKHVHVFHLGIENSGRMRVWERGFTVM